MALPLTFTFDSRKAKANLRKHGISFDEAATVFDDPQSLSIPDGEHEERSVTLGYSFRQRLLLVVHTELVDDRIRIISARKATRHEQRQYEES